MSVRESVGRPRACSGDIYAAVPMITPGTVGLCAYRAGEVTVGESGPPGVTADDGEPSAVRLPASLTGSVFYIGVNPTATLVLDIRKRLSGSTSSSIGSLSISTGGVYTPTFASQTDFAVGDHLEVINAASADATAADFSHTFLGTRIP